MKTVAGASIAFIVALILNFVLLMPRMLGRSVLPISIALSEFIAPACGHKVG